MDKEVTDLPDPDSPTSATISPRFTSREIFFKAFTVAVSVSKSTQSSFICNSGRNEVVRLSEFQMAYGLAFVDQLL